MYKVLIIDDEPVARERIRDLLKNEKDIEIAGECRNGLEAVSAIVETKPDLIFLDIQMPGMDGFEVLSEIRKENLPETIFVTAYDNYTLQAFSAHALDYLLKPFDDERFIEALQYARNRMEQKRANPVHPSSLVSLIEKLVKEEKYIRRIQVKLNQRVFLVNVDDIHSFEAEGCYVRIRKSDDNYLLRETLHNLEKKLDPRKFARIHRSTIINLDSLIELQRWTQNEWIALLKNDC
ncbi:MAG: response regulator transcription factor, partial [bacterium]|nr:response regulator transcription factor [bacterium]